MKKPQKKNEEKPAKPMKSKPPKSAKPADTAKGKETSGKKLLGNLFSALLNHVSEIQSKTADALFQFDADKELREAFAKHPSEVHVFVRLRFNPEATPDVLFCELHESQKVTMMEDGSADLTMTVPYIDELVRWTMSKGSKAVVLEPEELRQTVISNLKAVIAMYSKE